MTQEQAAVRIEEIRNQITCLRDELAAIYKVLGPDDTCEKHFGLHATWVAIEKLTGACSWLTTAIRDLTVPGKETS